MSEFQVGDTVKYIALDSCATRKDGLIGKVVKISDYGLPKVLWEDGSEGCHSSGYVALVSNAEPKDDQYAAGTIDAHYRKCAIEPMTYSMANGLDAMQHTIVKYVTRFRDKNGIRDLYAARHVVDMLIAHEEGKAND